MKRILLIARREYAAYAKTVGFWLSLLALPIFGVLGGVLPALIVLLANSASFANLALKGEVNRFAVEKLDLLRGELAAVYGAHGLLEPAVHEVGEGAHALPPDNAGDDW